MNELRFVLVPKRLTDEQFWSIYFALTRARLPKEAFDASLQAPPPEPPKPATVPQVAPSGTHAFFSADSMVFPALRCIEVPQPCACPGHHLVMQQQ